MPAAPLARSFPPIAGRGARVLILGSMPGVASLTAGQYYAHPRNAFWPIMGELFGAGPALTYDQRCRRLRGVGVAVWDVLSECRRPGSLDASIDPASEAVNDFETFFARYPGIQRIYFNGQKAETTFRRAVRSGQLSGSAAQIPGVRLPSTSPAHAGRGFQEKLRLWRVILDDLQAN